MSLLAAILSLLQKIRNMFEIHIFQCAGQAVRCGFYSKLNYCFSHPIITAICHWNLELYIFISWSVEADDEESLYSVWQTTQQCIDIIPKTFLLTPQTHILLGMMCGCFQPWDIIGRLFFSRPTPIGGRDIHIGWMREEGGGGRTLSSTNREPHHTWEA